MEPDIEQMVRELYDKQQIREVVTRYARGVDRMDHDLLMSAYHPDAIDDHGFFVGGPEAFWDWVRYYHTNAQTSHQHILGNHSCELDGDTAHCETYWMATGMDAADGSLTIAGGRYIDRMEKRDGQWRIAARKCVGDWGGVPTLSKIDPQALTMLQDGGIVARDRTDCSYERPLSVDPARIGLAHDILPPGYAPEECRKGEETR